MARNRKFKNSYIVTIEGTTSNGFQAELFDNLIHAVGDAVGINSQQSRVTIKVLETSGDFDADVQQVTEGENNVPQ